MSSSELPYPVCTGSEPVAVYQQTNTDYSEFNDDDDMVTTERELAEDAQWKKIQQNTFTRWANEHLKTVSKHIGNLETDLSDGLRLITLIEVLSGKRLPKHNKKPSFRSQKLENVSVALKFLQDDEGIRIVNIGEYRAKNPPVYPKLCAFSPSFFSHKCAADGRNCQFKLINFYTVSVLNFSLCVCCLLFSN